MTNNKGEMMTEDTAMLELTSKLRAMEAKLEETIVMLKFLEELDALERRIRDAG